MGDLMTEQTSVSEQSSGMAIASMVCGICSLVLFFFFGIVLAIVAVILGHIHLTNIKKEPEKFAGRGMAVAGLATGYVAIGITAFTLVVAGSALAILA